MRWVLEVLVREGDGRGGVLFGERERGGGKYVCEGFPVGFHFRGGVAPLFADDFGDFGVGEAGVLGDDGGLVVLAVEDECWESVSQRSACLYEYARKRLVPVGDR